MARILPEWVTLTEAPDVQCVKRVSPLPRAADLWVQASLDQKHRLQQLFFPEGVAFDGNRFNRTAVRAPLFKYLAPSDIADEKMVSRDGIEPSTRRLRAAPVSPNNAMA